MIINRLTIFNPTKVFQNRKRMKNYHTFVSQLTPIVKSKKYNQYDTNGTQA
ncbi:hypothetical protein HMPREF9445_01620 [Bacteroides clarus YIT 12056]|uniref:Uncharacterized protein n=1 Tax=Bacteroides clarus YIT 12056 TaxID=762984 RepID=A0ABP2KSV4_9BACE|nr:hypothetical protein HMPREF9445_01620 [Bacteroides clarus YIT 12056]